MHHKDHAAHVEGFRFAPEDRTPPPPRRTFNALRMLKWAAIIAAALIVARCAGIAP